MDFRNRTCVVTGSAGGMGKALGLRYSALGANVALLDRNLPALRQVQSAIETGGGRAQAIEVDLASSREIDRAMREVEDHFGAVHVLANCAGISDSTLMLDLGEEVWDRVMNINLKAVFLLSQKAAENMIRHRVKNGKIVSISSQAAKIGEYGGSVYDASKAGVNMLTQVFAQELAQHGISVTAVCPGFVNTEMIRGFFERAAKLENLSTEDFKGRLLAQVPIGRLAEPEEVAELMAFLTSDAGSYITGESINITGGKTNV